MGQGVMSLRLCWARWKRASYQIAYYKAQTIIGRLSLPIGVESVNTNSISKQVLESLKTGEEYRHSFVEEKVKTKIASQILAIRNQRGMDYKTFAQQLGKKTAWAYRLEDPNAGAPTISTLLGVARAFDVDLEVRFRPFSKLITEIDNLSSEPLAVPSFMKKSPIQEATTVCAPPGLSLCHRPRSAKRVSLSSPMLSNGTMLIRSQNHLSELPLVRPRISLHEIATCENRSLYLACRF